MISISQLRFRYTGSDFELRLPDLEIAERESLAVVGPSGCGKTTLLNLMAGIYLPDSGEVVVNHQQVSRLSDAARRNFRISQIGMVFQQFELVDYLDLKRNILLPYLINRSLPLTDEVEQRAIELAENLGLGDKLNRRPSQLSQGEKQRCAIGRALITEPKVILADEPTGNLDPANKRVILDLMFEQIERHGQTLVLVTHDMSLLKDVDRSLNFADLHHPLTAAAKETP